jgi:hypothetical protein
MNTLSWLIYFGDVTKGLAATTAMAAFCSLLVAGMASIPPIIHAIENDGTAERVAELARPVRRAAFFTLIISAAINALIPSREAVYMIAASELGERAIAQPATAELLSDVGQIIRSEVTKLKEKAK